MMYAKWDDIERAVRNAVEGALLDGDPMDPPPTKDQLAWADDVADSVVKRTMQSLDGYTAADLANYGG